MQIVKKLYLKLFDKNKYHFEKNEDKAKKNLATYKEKIEKKINDILIEIDKSKVVKINWKLRTEKYGKYGVISTDTPQSEFDYVTNLQKKIMFSNLRRFVTKREKKILDYGCGSGRFSKELTKINHKAKVIAVDTEKKLISLAQPQKRVTYVWLKNLSQIKMKFDIIFIANVLGGIEKKSLPKLISFLISKLNKNGIIFLSEHISNKKIQGPEILKGWAFRDDDFYLKLFKGF